VTRLRASLWRFLAVLLIAGVALQLFFLLRIALMVVVAPHSTAFERSEIWRLMVLERRGTWHQEWRNYPEIAGTLKRAVIASEDARFADHSGVEWDALEAAWERNLRAQAKADAINQKLLARAERRGEAVPPQQVVVPRIVGGSTITQQLAKNLFMSGERSLLRKGQEFAVTFMLEALLSKERILEIYLNHVEWGEGVFGAQAAAQRYYRVDASRLGPVAAARLAVMLPAPKRFEKRPGSAYVIGRAGSVTARMGAVELP
jgi:monofunctional glycosyltransferase